MGISSQVPSPGQRRERQLSRSNLGRLRLAARGDQGGHHEDPEHYSDEQAEDELPDEAITSASWNQDRR